MRTPTWGWLAVLGVVGASAIAGCAVGTEPELTGEDDLASAVVDGGLDANEPRLGDSTEDDDQDAGADDAGDPGLVDDDAGADAGADSGVTDPGGGATCLDANTCSGAADLGSISGDDGSDTVTASGALSEWFTVFVTEDSSGVGPDSLEMKATLTSPPGVDFDLYLYKGGSTAAVPACGIAAAGSSTQTSGDDVAGLEFGESGIFANGSDDHRAITVEVRHVSGTCDPGATWSLEITGNTH